MNEESRCWCLVRKRGGTPDNWLHLEVGGTKVFTGVEARELLKANPGWQMLHYPGYYEPPPWTGNPDHPMWGRSAPPHPAWSAEKRAEWEAEQADHKARVAAKHAAKAAAKA